MKWWMALGLGLIGVWGILHQYYVLAAIMFLLAGMFTMADSKIDRRP